MAIVNDEEVFNDAGDQNDWTGGTLGDTVDFDPPQTNNNASATEIYREGTACQEWVLKENITDGYTYTNQINNGTGGSRDITGGRVVVFWMFFTSDADLNKLTDFDIRISSDTGFTTNYAEWDAATQIYNLDLYGWYPVILYPTNPDGTAGTIVYSSIDSIGWVASTGPNGTKLSGFDQCHSISYIGGNNQTFTLGDLKVNNDDNDLGVVFEFGDLYKFQVNVRIGGGAGSPNTSLTIENQSLFFDNVEPEHTLGFIAADNTGGGLNTLVLNASAFSWNDQLGSPKPQIFTDAEFLDSLQVSNCTFARGGGITLPSTGFGSPTTSYFFTDNTVDNCDQIDPGAVLFQRININNSRESGDVGAVYLDGTGTSLWSDLSFTRRTIGSPTGGHAIEIGPSGGSPVGGTYSFDNFTYTDYYVGSPNGPGSNLTPNSGDPTAAVFNNSGGFVTLNINGGNTPAVRNGPGSTTEVIANPVTTLITVVDAITGDPVRNARVWLNDTGSPITTYIFGEGGTLTDASGQVSDTRSLVADLPVSGRVRKATSGGGSPFQTNFYKTGIITGTIDNITGFTVTINLIPDE